MFKKAYKIINGDLIRAKSSEKSTLDCNWADYLYSQYSFIHTTLNPLNSIIGIKLRFSSF